MSFSDRFVKVFKSLLPAPFTIAVLLTAVTFLLALLLTEPSEGLREPYALLILEYWEAGIWNNSLLVFAIQMMLMLVLGHVLALTKPVNRLMDIMLKYCSDTPKAAFIVTFFTILVSLFNWGLGLIFGAIFARKVGENASLNNIKLNYPLIGAAGYSGLMVWHGGLSGSSLVKVAEPGHIREMMEGLFTPGQINDLPGAITFSETVFSPLNITVSCVLFTLLPAGMYWLGKRSMGSHLELSSSFANEKPIEKELIKGAEKLDHARWLSSLFAAVILGFATYLAFIKPKVVSLSFITPNYINFVLLGLGVLFHQSFAKFLKAVDNAISGAAGILIQFPLYFGIMGIMKSSGLVTELSSFFVSISNPVTYPVFTFFSAGIVNIFVPSGGGQWAVQGPIIIQAANELGLPLSKSIMALAYGDQITNMLQPFWALPLLGITGLKAKEILPYTFFLLVLGCIIFISGLLIF